MTETEHEGGTAIRQFLDSVLSSGRRKLASSLLTPETRVREPSRGPYPCPSNRGRNLHDVSVGLFECGNGMAHV